MKGWRGRMILLAAFVALNGLLAYYLLPEPVPARVAEDTTPPWELPAPPATADLEADYQKLRKLQPWGAEEAAVAKPGQKKAAPKSTWRFGGVVYSDGTPHMLVLENNKLQRYAIGTELPDGTRLVAIHPDAVEVEEADNRETRKLYAQK